MGSLKCLFGWPFWRPGCLSWKFFIKCLGVVHMTKLHWPEFHTRMTFWFCIMFIWWWVISYLGYLNVHYMLIKYMCESNRKHYACATHSSQLADRFDTETGGHFTFTWCHCEIFTSLRYNNLNGLTSGWLATAWHFVMVLCTQMSSHEGEPESTRAGAKVALVSCKHPLRVNPWKPGTK